LLLYCAAIQRRGDGPREEDPGPRGKTMKQFVNVVCTALVLVLFAAGVGAQDNVSSYRLGAGDVITVQVLGEDDLRREKIRLSDAATISYPILGEIRLAGKTVGELERLIHDGLKGRYLVNPQVTVTINEYRSFFINGQIERPGGYPFMPGLTVRKAVSLAGGFKERASRDKIFLIREEDRSQTPRKVDLNAAVNPGDIITVEESFF
jgi:polysaccharide biosynthesis/export protein VpsN